MARNYKKEYETYQGTEIQKKRRALRNKARREAIRSGTVKKGDGKDIDHRIPLSRGGSNAKPNLRVQSRSANRSFDRAGPGGKPVIKRRK